MISDINSKQNAAAAAAIDDNETEIDLLELLYAFWQNMKYIVLVAIAGALLAGGYSYFLAVPMYSSTASMYVISSRDSVVDLSSIQIGSYLTTDYQEVLKTWEVHERVMNNLELNYTLEEVENMMTITNPSNTRII